MKTKQLIVEVALHAPTVTGFEAVKESPAFAAGLEVDPSFPLTPIPQLITVKRTAETAPLENVFARGVDRVVVEAPLTSAIVRVPVPANIDPRQHADMIEKQPGVIAVFADVPIQPYAICPGSPPLGTHLDVERLLDVADMRACGMDGSGVMVAIVDTGFNLAYLNAHGKTPSFDAARSWVPRAGLTPGAFAVAHGTMCAFDVCIAAPKCTLLDIAVVASTTSGGSIIEGLLSDAVRAYNHLLALMRGPLRPGETRSLVVNNSWGMFQPSWDFPVGDPRNYSDNPAHPFNRIVATLAAAGADILFAAGNCGHECPDSRCGAFTDAIYGANSHPDVITVAGIDTTKQRVGYSTMGPGRLHEAKPDISGYTHFAGSGVFSADGGTSAATPVVAGVVAAVRSKRPHDPTRVTSSPAAIKSLLTSTAEDLGPSGFDHQFGFGAVNGAALRSTVCPFAVGLCETRPWLCPPRHVCRMFPRICDVRRDFLLPVPEPLLDPVVDRFHGPRAMASGVPEVLDNAKKPLGVSAAYWAGFEAGYDAAILGPHGPASTPAPSAPAKRGCGCNGRSV